MLKPRQRGFTLLELLVVVFIIGLMSGFVVLSINPQGAEGPRLDQEHQRLQRLLTLAAQEAVLQGREVGVMIYADGYEFVLAGLEEWEATVGSTLKPKALPRGWRIELTQDGRLIPPLIRPSEQEEKEDEDEESPFPQIIFFTSGEATPFQLDIHSDPDSGSGSRTIHGNENGMAGIQQQQSQT